MHDDELDPVHSSDNPDTDNSRRLYVKKMNLVSGTGAVQELSPAYYEGLMRQIEKGDSVSLDHRVVEVTLVDIQGNEHHLANHVCCSTIALVRIMCWRNFRRYHLYYALFVG